MIVATPVLGKPRRAHCKDWRTEIIRTTYEYFAFGPETPVAMTPVTSRKIHTHLQLNGALHARLISDECSHSRWWQI